jgi:hypothetical protein
VYAIAFAVFDIELQDVHTAGHSSTSEQMLKITVTCWTAVSTPVVLAGLLLDNTEATFGIRRAYVPPVPCARWRPRHTSTTPTTSRGKLHSTTMSRIDSTRDEPAVDVVVLRILQHHNYNFFFPTSNEV